MTAGAKAPLRPGARDAGASSRAILIATSRDRSTQAAAPWPTNERPRTRPSDPNRITESAVNSAGNCAAAGINCDASTVATSVAVTDGVGGSRPDPSRDAVEHDREGDRLVSDEAGQRAAH